MTQHGTPVRRAWPAWTALGIGLVLTLAASLYTWSRVEAAHMRALTDSALRHPRVLLVAGGGTLLSLLLAGLTLTFHQTRARASALRERESLLRAATERQEAIISALPDLLFVIGRDGRIREFRAPAPGRLYLPPEAFLGRTVAEVMPPAAATVIMDAITEAAEHGTAASMHWRCRRARPGMNSRSPRPANPASQGRPSSP